ncbi:ATP-binding protein [Pseudomonas nitroreducens]|uniref:ATP-binding protein n=1 Tax=Pseudomonas nitroreducens TaxID=46680 RepID=UPI001FB665BD|nr:winged helix-turn-helix domain-containing protein [Pseudomonas nitroreducens]MCJ1882379.1 winged helix-turn-helix domain-containing protein [Pseudomonas nitroreducens]MCJ1893749.1 winged helix-turn-helix domain-containing protein [Pseudomonas nitroreducens]
MTPEPVATVETVLHFGPYQIFPTSRMILEAGRPLRLGQRALDILLALLERAGQVVSKGELLARAWPGQDIDEGNLRVHMAALRKALGDGQNGRRFIVTVALRGYSFVEPLTASTQSTPAHDPGAAANHNLPPRRNRLLGRETELERLVAELPQRRCISLVGSGGIGKTSLALQAAERFIGQYRHGIRMLDLTPLQDARPLNSTLASALGIPGLAGESLEQICTQVADRQMLLLIDNCEHLIEAAAHLVECLLRHAPQMHILATSRESLRATGEHIQPLRPLACPPARLGSIEDALAYPAVALLIERAKETHEEFEFRPEDLPRVGEICRRLEGIPLALELAAGHLGQADGSIDALLQGGYLDLPLQSDRHQHLRAMLDWSYALLRPAEQSCLRRLSVFRGSFTLDSVAAALGQPADLGTAFLLVNHLTAKSLLSTEVRGDEVTYRLLEPTRLYALEKLEATGELHEARERHLELCERAMQAAQDEWERSASQGWLQRHAPWLADVRAALDWGLHAEVRHTLAIHLAACSSPLWQELSLLHEYGPYVSAALGLLGAQSAASLELAMRLELALGNTTYHDVRNSQANEAFQNARFLAQQIGDRPGELTALSGGLAVLLWAGQYQLAAEHSQHFDRLSSGQGEILATSALRLKVLALHYSGNQVLAQSVGDDVLERLEQQRQANRFAPCLGVQYDQQVASLATQARTLWLRGLPEQAERMAAQAIELACEIDHSASIAYSLAAAGCVIAFYNGELDKARQRVRQMVEVAERHRVPLFTDWARHYAWAMRFEDSPGAPAVGLVRDIVQTLGGRPLPADPAQLMRARTGAAGWCAPEILRNEAVALLERDDRESLLGAETLLTRALALAQEQGALAWELRSATCLAGLWHTQGRSEAARQLLQPVYRRFTEGFDSPDQQRARRCLELCDSAGN